MLSFTEKTVHFCGAELSSVDSTATVASSSLSSSFSSSLSVELLATPPAPLGWLKSGEYPYIYHTIHYWIVDTIPHKAEQGKHAE